VGSFARWQQMIEFGAQKQVHQEGAVFECPLSPFPKGPFMHLLKLAALIVATSIVLAACMHSTTPQGQGSSTLQLSTKTVSLRGSDTVASVKATLTCGCPFMFESIRITGDTDAICFNVKSLTTSKSDQQLIATVTPNRMRSAAHAQACISFVVNDRMMKSICMDSVTVHYYKQ
jgi:hypothetical protein